MTEKNMMLEMAIYMDSILKKFSGHITGPFTILDELNMIEDSMLGSNKGLFLITLRFYLQLKSQNVNPRDAFNDITTESIMKPKVREYFVKHDKRVTTIVTELRSLLALLKKNEIDLETFFTISYILFLGADKMQKPFVLQNVFNLFDALDINMHNVYSPDLKEPKKTDTIDAKEMKIEWN